MITTIIADDEGHARERLHELLNRFNLFTISAEAQDGNDALQCIIEHKPQVAFLDINMPGISVFTSIPSLQNPPIIIFQTAYSEHAADAFDISALDYLLKPIRIERLEKTVEKIKEKLALGAADQTTASSGVKQTEHISVKVSGKTKVIPVHEILRISFQDGFTFIYTTAQDKLISDKYLNYYEEKLPDNMFFRTGRTDIINLNHIASIHKMFQGMYTIELKNGTQVDLSRRKAQRLKEIIEF